MRENSNSAIVVENATLSWTKPDTMPDCTPGLASGFNNVDDISQTEAAETLPTLRNISFTLPKVRFTTDV